MIGVQVEVKGLAELGARLGRLPLKIEKKILGAALKSGAAVIVEPARQAAPTGRREYEYGNRTVRSRRRIGQLRRAIRAFGSGRRQGGAFVLPIGFSAAGYYGRFLERGWTPTGPHRAWRTKKGLTRDSARRVLQRGRSKIPGQRFVAESARRHMDRAVRAVAASLERRLPFAEIGR